MSHDRREAQVRQYLDEVFNGHDLSRLHKYLGADLVSHWLGDRTLHGLPAWFGTRRDTESKRKPRTCRGFRERLAS